MILKMKAAGNGGRWTYIDQIIEIDSYRKNLSKEEVTNWCKGADREVVNREKSKKEGNQVIWMAVRISSCLGWLTVVCDGEVYLMNDKGETIERLF